MTNDAALASTPLTGAVPRKGTGDAIALAALVLLAVMLRLVPVLFVPSLDWPDEIFQTIEQAHRLVYGTGLVPWEFQLGVRSWLLPGTIAVIMEAARFAGDGPDYYLPAIAIAFAALAAAPVACCFLWCRRWFGLPAACVGAAVVALAPDLVYLGARSLNEVVAAHVMVVALFVIEPATRRRLVLGGALLGLALVLRVQLAPALVLIAAWPLMRTRGQGASALILGGVSVALCAALLDWVTLGAPLASIWRYVIVNLYDGVSSSNGIEPWSFYGTVMAGLWRAALAVPLVLAAIGARRMIVPLAAAALLVLAHMAIAHKEYRFLYPAVLLVMISAGIGLARLVTWAETAATRRFAHAQAVCAVAALAYWSLVSYQVWNGPGFSILRHVAHDGLAADLFVAGDADVCGVGIDYGPAGRHWIYGSYSYLHRAVPRYWPDGAANVAADSSAFNTLISTGPPSPNLGYTVQQCFGDACVARRPGGCSALPMKTLPLPDVLR
jgi:GPI mannosyltransferase 3